MTTWTTPLFLISYEAPDLADSWQNESSTVAPRIGEGIIGPRGRRWRVVDVWHSTDDKHAPIELGVTVYVEPVVAGSDDDRPGRLHPDYYLP
jgi:hypothetical protein